MASGFFSDLHNERPDRFAALARNLPFSVDEYDAVRTVYVRWRRTGESADREIVELWAYCYVLRYFYTKFAAERTSEASDLDKVVGNAVRRIFRSLESVRDPERFPQFVSVVCRRVLLSYRERRRDLSEIEESMGVTEIDTGAHDRALVWNVLARAIERLPAKVADAARRRLIGGAEYAEIAEAMNREIPTIRTYVSRALAKLRKDPELLALYGEVLDADVREDTEEPADDVRSKPPPGLEP